MKSLAEQLAAALASTDGIPRVIKEFSILYLVTPTGDVWRVFDSEDGTPATRRSAADDPNVNTRIFIGGGPYPAVRVYRFLEREDRAVSAERLVEQLAESRASV
jgi:hypothetical protein